MLSGWRRNVRVYKLIDADISKLEPSENREYWEGTTYIETRESREDQSREVEIVRKAPELALNGDYMVRLRLSKADVANLVRIAFSDDALVAALSKRKPVKK